MKHKRNLLLGIIAGIAMGIVAGMLFSPEKGRVIRKIIRRKGEDIVEDVTETIEDVTETIEEGIELLGHTISDKVATLKTNIASALGSS
jgi:gas vesicle protein